MRDDKRLARMRQIETEAYALFEAQGFEGTSMLAVAKRAKASNETLYRWYGDKAGLFRSMVEGNAEVVRAALDRTRQAETAPLAQLRALAPVLLGMLLSERAILLNRAAASDPTGALGQALAQAGREAIMPIIETVLQAAAADGQLRQGAGQGALLVRLLVGDSQIRRVIGVLPVPSEAEVEKQAETAVAQFLTLCQP